MTEYTTSSQAYREFMSARERTAYWVRSHEPNDADFYSPSIPPSVIDGLVHSNPPSDAGSTHSTPPKMVLRYNDGRPDIPIPHPNPHYIGRSGSTRHQNPDLTRSRTLSYNHSHNRARSGSNASPTSPLSRSRRHDDQAPEEIRILPSFGNVPTSSSSSRPGHSRSRSVPRGADLRQEQDHEVPFLPPAHMQNQSPYYTSPHANSPTHQVTFAPPAQPSQPWHPRQPHKQAPAIVYAPSHHAQRPQYSPPAMFHHPPQMGPNGLIYSHSAPVPGQYPPQYATQYPSAVGSHRHTASAHDVRGGHGPDFARPLGHSARRNPHPADASAEDVSEKSGSTYYVLPSHGQKVHVITPSPEHSVITATSTTKSPTSHYGSGKKAFFQRLFSFPKFSVAGSSRGSSVGGRKLHRRHSIGASGRHGVEEGQ